MWHPPTAPHHHHHTLPPPRLQPRARPRTVQRGLTFPRAERLVVVAVILQSHGGHREGASHTHTAHTTQRTKWGRRRGGCGHCDPATRGSTKGAGPVARPRVWCEHTPSSDTAHTGDTHHRCSTHTRVLHTPASVWLFQPLDRGQKVGDDRGARRHAPDTTHRSVACLVGEFVGCGPAC